MCQMDMFVEKINTHPDLTPYAKVNFSWIVDLNLAKIIKFPEESAENSSMISLFGNSGYKSYYFKNLLIGYIKINNICLSKDTKKMSKRESQWGKVQHI